MGTPFNHILVKLIVGLFSRKETEFSLARKILESRFGRVDKETPFLEFSHTNYYEKEFGKNLKRKFLSFYKLLSIERGYRIKLFTNKVEKRLSVGKNGHRTINIDPGYITLSSLVLYTTKPSSHRIYLGNGIYGDVELRFINKSFKPLEWTYPDYRSKEYIDFFNSVREIYISQAKRYL